MQLIDMKNYLKYRLGDNQSSQSYYSLGLSEFLSFLENMRYPLSFRSVSSKNSIEIIKERKDIELKICEIFSTNDFDISKHVIIAGESSNHHTDLIARKKQFFISDRYSKI